MSSSLKKLPESERPRERLIKYGPENLSTSELIAIILRTGTKGKSAIDIATNLLASNGGLSVLAASSPEELSSMEGIGIAKAAELKAVVELGKRLRNHVDSKKQKITNPQEAADYVMDEMRYFKKEYLRVMFLNTKNIIIDIKDISIGSLNSSIVHPREIFLEAIKKSSSSIIIFHNHPSGDPKESTEDINITRRISEAGKIIGIELVDHIIIGNGTYNSLKQKNLF